MASADSASSQLQPFLPGMGNSSAIGRAVRAKKQPHQMTPEEFAAQPNAVFHTSHLYPESVRNMDTRQTDFNSGLGTSPAIHVGSEQAALENAARTVDRYDTDILEDEPARLHVFHYTAKPGDNMLVHEDGIPYLKPGANAQNIDPDHDEYNSTHNIYPGYEYTHDLHDMPGLLYRNAAEDKGSVSISVMDVSRLKSQGDFVRDAIASGKGDEVHPKTMAMYKAGSFDKGDYLDPDGLRTIKNKNEPNRSVNPMNYERALQPQDITLRPGQQFSPREHGFPEYWKDGNLWNTPEKTSERGPQLEAIKRMARKKK